MKTILLASSHKPLPSPQPHPFRFDTKDTSACTCRLQYIPQESRRCPVRCTASTHSSVGHFQRKRERKAPTRAPCWKRSPHNKFRHSQAPRHERVCGADRCLALPWEKAGQRQPHSSRVHGTPHLVHTRASQFENHSSSCHIYTKRFRPTPESAEDTRDNEILKPRPPISSRAGRTPSWHSRPCGR